MCIFSTLYAYFDKDYYVSYVRVRTISHVKFANFFSVVLYNQFVYFIKERETKSLLNKFLLLDFS